MHKICALLFQLLIIHNTFSQYTIGPSIKASSQQIVTPKQVSKQQLLNYFLSNTNETPLSERIEALATAVQQMPPKNNKRVYLADVLRQTAIQNLIVAASVCNEATTVNAPVATEYVNPSRIVEYAPSPLTRNVVVANANDMPLVANRRNVVVANDMPLVARRNVVVANANDVPLVANRRNVLVANRELLSLLPRDLLSALVRFE